MKKIISSFLVLLLATLVVNVPISANSFTDVNERYTKEVQYIVEKNYANGISATKFGTSSPIKRIDAAVMIAKTMGFDQNSNAPASGLSDVPKNRAWAVNALVDAGIVSGKLGGKYGSHDFMTRAEMSKVIASAYELQANTLNIPFTDVNKTFQPYVAALVENSITSGKTPTKFGSTDNITRGEFAIFIYKADHLSTTSPIPPEVESVQ